MDEAERTIGPASRRQFGPFVIDIRERVLTRDGEAVPLTPKAFDLLATLVERPGELISKDEFFQKVWPCTIVEESNLAYNVFALRKALGDTADNPQYIETVPRRGYRFKAPVSFDGTAVLRTAPQDLTVEAGSTNAPASAGRSPVGRRRIVIAAAAALVVAAYPGWRWWRGEANVAAPRALPLTAVQGVVHSPSLSPDGNYVAFTWSGPNRDNFNIYVQQVGAGSPHQLTSDPKNDHAPSWSPNGRAIAFLRRGPGSGRSEIWQIAPLGGTERKVAEIDPRLASFRPNTLAWCPDSSCVLVTDSSGADQADAVFAVAIDTGERRQLTFPRSARDADPAVSPDGRHLIFRRDTTPFSGRFHRVALNARLEPVGEPVPLTEILSAGKAVWMPDSREVLFSWRGSVWRLDALRGGMPRRVPFVGDDGIMPVVAPTSDGRLRLVYVRSVTDTNVWRIDVPAAGVQASSAAAIAIGSPRSDDMATISCDATRLAFLSNRSGELQLWVARPDGGEAFQLTSIAFSSTPGFPRWSPDGRLIAFHGDPEGRPDVFVVRSSGGRPMLLRKDAAYPTFSRDGQWIYLSSRDAKGEFRIFKVPAAGGEARQVTDNRGALAIESENHDLYYVDRTDRPGSLWRLPADAGPASKILDGVIGGSFDVVDPGIYYIDRVAEEAGTFVSDRPGGETRLRFFDFASQRSKTVAVGLGTVTFGLSATRDGRTVFYSRLDSSIDELMVVHDFR
jgi:Tol biopolymer transport system component/DNA-binding winged helix-turn-helix (wHTH) protein